MTTRRVIILGSTGSIGTQAVEVIEHVNAMARAGKSPISFEVVGLAAGKNATLLAEQARRLGVKHVGLANGESDSLPTFDLPTGCRVLRGTNSAEELVRAVECDIVVAAMVGIAGLPATVAAVQCGRLIALANKETLVAAGELVVPRILADRENFGETPYSPLMPVDSEHAALFQCLSEFEYEPVYEADESGIDEDYSHHNLLATSYRSAPPRAAGLNRVRRATLTASGGPFREWTIDQLERATPEQALKHPTWSMGAKVTIDSATLMNKALELIEAHWLFGLPADKLDAIVHPQSLVHAIVEFLDGSSVAQLAAPDMKTPIQRALTWPFCLEGCSRRIDWASLRSLAFEPVDHARFPAVSLAYHVMERGGTSGAILNAANEVAVEAFLAGRTGFRSITRHVEAALADIPTREVRTLADVLEADAAARDFVRSRIERGVR
ncbi:MAG TPA: 1-deoxy-D-xylulose-5-phosphate reductoisomerase [Phycisphaerales bacterium]|nr:1-deoxy-D-xylulose-5-phosphate reductoisomerase [Phycisphaerales bacterium]